MHSVGLVLCFPGATRVCQGCNDSRQLVQRLRLIRLAVLANLFGTRSHRMASLWEDESAYNKGTSGLLTPLSHSNTVCSVTVHII